MKVASNFNMLMVGKRGFEPRTPASRTLCSTRLSHFPKCFHFIKTICSEVKRNNQTSRASFQ